MIKDDHPREQTILFLVCTIVASACTQLGMSLLFHEWSGPIGGLILLAMALAALAVAAVWPRLQGKLSRDLLSEFVDLVVRRRFTLAMVCIVVVALLNVWPRSWPMLQSPSTRLVLVFPTTSYDPIERTSSNVHWSAWSGLQEENSARPWIEDDVLRDDGRQTYAHDVTVLFLRFDAPVDCERFTLAMADWSRVPEATTFRKDARTAVLVIRGRIKRDVEVTIEPASASARRI